MIQFLNKSLCNNKILTAYLCVSNLFTGLYYIVNYFSPEHYMPLLLFHLFCVNVILSCLVFFTLPHSLDNVKKTTLLMFFSNLPLFVTLFLLAFKIGSYSIISFTLLNVYWSLFALTFLFYGGYVEELADKFRPKLSRLNLLVNNSYFKFANLVLFIAYLVFMYIKINIY